MIFKPPLDFSPARDPSSRPGKLQQGRCAAGVQDGRDRPSHDLWSVNVMLLEVDFSRPESDRALWLGAARLSRSLQLTRPAPCAAKSPPASPDPKVLALARALARLMAADQDHEPPET
jgi:hypothetical protein